MLDVLSGATAAARKVSRDSVVRELAHVSNGWRPTILQLQVRRYGCAACGHVWRQDLSQAAAPRAKLSTDAVLSAGRAMPIDDPARLLNG